MTAKNVLITKRSAAYDSINPFYVAEQKRLAQLRATAANEQSPRPVHRNNSRALPPYVAFEVDMMLARVAYKQAMEYAAYKPEEPEQDLRPGPTLM